jgi:hypothetical protein
VWLDVPIERLIERLPTDGGGRWLPTGRSSNACFSRASLPISKRTCGSTLLASRRGGVGRSAN